ncbi:hypothetical protein JOC70_000192 [Clostridium pascui]|uniref:hypothetical protein n=1 Tax=Clostridium pascui TaxID=46609 RepID=UPI00195E4D54|nr:hypothetical protein [Clostridium pascui]MBM7868723.1 hypothetical protein [Clostridium pascui]
MNCTPKGKVFKYMAYIAIINIVLIILYLTSRIVINKWHLALRGWVGILYMTNIIVLAVISIMFINKLLSLNLYSKIKNAVMQKTIKVISLVITAIIIISTCLYGLLLFSFTYAPEHVVYHDSQKVIAKVSSYGFHHSRVDFYEPINLFFMRKSNIESEIYDGSYDRYKKDN